MRKGFIFLLIIWNVSPLASENSFTNQLQFWLGCRAVIPCQDCRSDSNSFKWFYKKDEQSDKIRIFSQDERGLQYHLKPNCPRMKVLRNCSLVINNITEDNQGLYWCENCFQDNCWNKQSTVISVKTEILKEVKKTVYVTVGNNFTQACPGEFNNLKWTFEASNKTALRDSVKRPESRFVTSSKSIHILNVRRADAGKYSCWTTGCDGHKQKLLTINLCVITVHHSEDSSVSCAVMCDIEFGNIKPNNISNVATRTVTVDQYGLLTCSTKQMLDDYSTIHSTHRPSNASSNPTGTSTEPELQILIYGTSAAATCLILMALLIYCLRTRLQTAFPIHLCCCGLNGRVEEETSVVYSSVVIRRPAHTTNNNTTDSDYVYSEINV